MIRWLREFAAGRALAAVGRRNAIVYTFWRAVAAMLGGGVA